MHFSCVHLSDILSCTPTPQKPQQQPYLLWHTDFHISAREEDVEIKEKHPKIRCSHGLVHWQTACVIFPCWYVCLCMMRVRHISHGGRSRLSSTWNAHFTIFPLHTSAGEEGKKSSAMYKMHARFLGLLRRAYSKRFTSRQNTGHLHTHNIHIGFNN